MTGVSVFFSGSFRQVFQAQEKISIAQEHFSANEILRSKFSNAVKRINGESDWAVIQNNTDAGQMPFSYITKNDDRLVFKDFFVFNGMYGSTPSSDSGKPNAGGITKIDDNYYVTAPFENAVYKCVPINSCDPLIIATDLNFPVDVTTDGTALFISDSGNNRVLKMDDPAGSSAVNEVSDEEDFNFPTGLTYYSPDDSLFVSDTYNNLVKKIDLSDNSVTIVAGLGDDDDCNNTAKYCKLNFPTGLYADSDNHILYISDTGSNRVLQVYDPTPKKGEDTNIAFSFELEDNYKLDKIELIGNFDNETFFSSNLINDGDDYNPVTKTFTSPTSPTSSTPISPEVYIFDSCGLLSVAFFVNIDLSAYNLWNGDFIVINDIQHSISSVLFPNAKDCDSSPGEDWHGAIFIPDPPGTTGITGGDSIYFSNRTDEDTVLRLNDMQFTDSGFQEIEIKTYEIGNSTEKETDYYYARVGDGILGTEEDKIGVIYSGLNFPTGVYYTSSLQVAEGINFDKNSIINFDYISDFELVDKDGINGLNFSVLGEILELKIKAKIDDNNYKTYTFNGKSN